ncbi:hypothetical protein AURDEDRAFT_156830 [Auricularia subglabra TFB-10046 SS5]|nr:hypothetical protein AURDEDRAFT_156830 [Auricularia subglabra TFB-10046 SS5]
MDPATIGFQRALVATLQDASEPLAALHKARTETLCPLSCPRCGHVALRTRKAKTRLERTCTRCRTVTYTQLPKAPKSSSARATEHPQPPPSHEEHQAVKAELQRAPTVSKAQPTSAAKRRKQGLEKLLAQSRQRQAQADAAQRDPFALGL